ncbi:hypothetical protein J4E82_011718 [Alternaria postmessia]|uniref:uncharacterized protein n=1 Tax=Alternaria postmessia TaxID=1187938 RepID=UPI002224917B|nr:uncharacterized protein J4E82_011718 [Alternaria postmessia]KAI5361804.1 hypothetical protein J4E82_011718 [Alternaria postmessia]
MQLQIARTSSVSVYKAVMVNLLASLLQSVKAHYEMTDIDLVYITSAKLTGRLQKLRKLIPGRSFDLYTKSAQTLLDQARSSMVARIDRVTNTAGSRIDMAVLADLQPDNELDIHLPAMDDFVSKISGRTRRTGVSNFRPTSKCLVCPEHELPTSFSGSGEYTYFYLATVERWVEDHLSSWTERHMSDDTSCGKLRQLLQEVSWGGCRSLRPICNAAEEIRGLMLHPSTATLVFHVPSQ